MSADDPPRAGRIAPAVAAEFPELALWRLDVERLGPPARSPDEVRERLRDLANRFRGAEAILMRTRPIPHAYRVFFRHIGLDPDAQRTPVEQRALERLMHGGFRSAGVVEDGLTIAIMETGVPVWALDAASLRGELEVRESEPGGRLVIADEGGPVAVLFGDTVAEHAVSKDTRRVALVSIQVAGVSSIHVEEALWLAATIVEDIP
jgi:DNA/RNA-binding domain of Phe-tRNA-synthetase-like protein